MKGKGTTDAIFIARQMQENFIVKGKKVYFGFVDLEKAFDRVPREVISWLWRCLSYRGSAGGYLLIEYRGVAALQVRSSQ